METHRTAAEERETDDGLVEAEVFGVWADAETAGVMVSERSKSWVGESD